MRTLRAFLTIALHCIASSNESILRCNDDKVQEKEEEEKEEAKKTAA